MIKVPDHVYVLGYTYTCHTLKNITDTHNNNTCDMYMSSLRPIHDPVLSSLKMKGIRFLFLSFWVWFRMCYKTLSYCVHISLTALAITRMGSGIEKIFQYFWPIFS
jgi:hypothetical protein